MEGNFGADGALQGSKKATGTTDKVAEGVAMFVCCGMSVCLRPG